MKYRLTFNVGPENKIIIQSHMKIWESNDPNDALESTPRMGIMIPMMPFYPSPGWGSLIPKMSIWFLETGIRESRFPFSNTINFAKKNWKLAKFSYFLLIPFYRIKWDHCYRVEKEYYNLSKVYLSDQLEPKLTI